MSLSYLFFMQKTMKTMVLVTLFFISMMNFGCSQKIRIESTPPGATVYNGANKIGETPFFHTVKWASRKQSHLRIELHGYRPMTINAGKDLGYRQISSDLLHFRYRKLTNEKAHSTRHVLLIRNHGSVGTWTPKDAKKQR